MIVGTIIESSARILDFELNSLMKKGEDTVKGTEAELIEVKYSNIFVGLYKNK